jgi:hypothetical protein
MLSCQMVHFCEPHSQSYMRNKGQSSAQPCMKDSLFYLAMNSAKHQPSWKQHLLTNNGFHIICHANRSASIDSLDQILVAASFTIDQLLFTASFTIGSWKCF